MLDKPFICNENISEIGGRKAQINPNSWGWFFLVASGQNLIAEFLKAKSEKILEDDSSKVEVQFLPGAIFSNSHLPMRVPERMGGL